MMARAEEPTDKGTTPPARASGLARRLLVVVLFLLGFGEAPFGSAEPGARGALEAARVAALAHGGPPADADVPALNADRHDTPAKGLNGGEDERYSPVSVQRRDLRLRSGRALQPGPAIPDHVHEGFKPRAPPAIS